MTTSQPHWYKQFWPWALIALPGSVVAASLYTAYLATHHADSLVADDYYKAGLAINTELSAQHYAAKQHMFALATLDTVTAQLKVDLHSDLPVLPATLQLRLIHPTLAQADRTLTLTRNSTGYYMATWPIALTGQQTIRWQVYLQDATHQWELTGYIKLPQQTHWTLISIANEDQP